MPPGRSGRPRSSPATSSTAMAPASEGYIEPDELLEFGDVGPGVRQGARGRGRRAAAGSARSRRRRSARWTARAAIAGVLGVVAIFAGLEPPEQRPAPHRRRARRRRRSSSAILARSMPAVSLPGRDDPGDARGLPADAEEDDGPGPIDGPGRRRGRACRGSRRPTRRSSGGRRSGSTTRSRRSSAGALEDQREGRVAPGSVWLPTWYGAGGRRRRRGRGGRLRRSGRGQRRALLELGGARTSAG